MKNILGHDDESEIFTLISRMRENKFSVLFFENDSFFFEIKLTYRMSVPVSNTTYQKIQYSIKRKEYNNTYEYFLSQINGKEERKIPFTDGYVIWALLEEKYNQ
jgi:hypothetical protein